MNIRMILRTSMHAHIGSYSSGLSVEPKLEYQSGLWWKNPQRDVGFETMSVV